MYFDESIVLSKNIPSDIAREFERAEDIYKNGKGTEAEFDILVSCIDVDIRNCLSYNILSEKEATDALKKIGYR